MKKTLGFDLGTTYSAVSVPERRTGTGFLTVPECPGVSLILDDKNQALIPSVVGENAKGDLVVGARAKRLAGMVPGPVMFSKRWMGANKTFRMKTLDPIRPVDAAAHILAHLKEMAETRLGYEVTDAVITVPAYFGLNAKQLTEVAGKRAGLNVAQIIQEPVAAAQVFLLNDPRERATVMTYDLGGGTFDVSVVKKQDGFMDNLAFAGDPALGGYNFDDALVSLIKEKIESTEANCMVDLNDEALKAKLMNAAERCKIALSRDFSARVKEIDTGVESASGQPLNGSIEISREEFENLVLPDLEKTISECEKAREVAGIEKDDIDEILLIGGSSQIPLVATLLKQAYGKEPVSIQPELCVALGAGITAGNLGNREGVVHLDFIPEETDLNDLDVTGKVVVGVGGISSAEGATVTLTTADGSFHSSVPVTSETGGFSFLGVPLEAEVENEFFLVVTDSSGAQAADQVQFSLRHRDRSDGFSGLSASPPNVLSKPISVLGADGVRDVITAKSALPTSVQIQAATTDTSGKVIVPVYENNLEIGRVEITELEKTMPVGTQVNIEVEVDLNYQVHAKAHIPSVDREALVRMSISERTLKSDHELRLEFARVNARAEEALTTGGTEALFSGGTAAKIEKVQEECARLLERENPDAVAVQNCLEDLSALADEMDRRWRPDPSRALFDSVMIETESELAALVSDRPETSSDGYDHSLLTIKDAADEAFQNQSGGQWSEEFLRLKQLRAQIEKLRDNEHPKPDDAGGPTDYNLILLGLIKDMENLKAHAKSLQCYDGDWKSAHELASEELNQINPDSDDVGNRVVEFYRTHLLNLQETLERKLKAGGEDGVVRIETVLN